jgi:hypothetical protein
LKVRLKSRYWICVVIATLVSAVLLPFASGHLGLLGFFLTIVEMPGTIIGTLAAAPLMRLLTGDILLTLVGLGAIAIANGFLYGTAAFAILKLKRESRP